jgi:HPt (histidine-containing phosphotransfer) domain-containing protein
LALNPRTIDELKSIGSANSMFARVMKLFLSQVPLALREIELEADHGDLKALADQVHALKSMCVTIGAMEAGRACEALEVSARKGDAEAVWPLMAEVIEHTLAAVEEAKGLL